MHVCVCVLTVIINNHRQLHEHFQFLKSTMKALNTLLPLNQSKSNHATYILCDGQATICTIIDTAAAAAIIQRKVETKSKQCFEINNFFLLRSNE